ncbi:factor H binding protein domain-containing protein [Mannheimia sp. HC-2023]|uniref:factor H binding protein domain-containing protein n=1 Tax=Mannheimia indoligenes TaxID=3103145 RepID=UPI002FE54C96
MSIKKVTLASLILLSLTACHGGSSSKVDKSQIDALNTQIVEQKNELAQAKSVNQKNEKLIQQLDVLQKQAKATNSELSQQIENLKQKLAQQSSEFNNDLADQIKQLKQKLELQKELRIKDLKTYALRWGHTDEEAQKYAEKYAEVSVVEAQNALDKLNQERREKIQLKIEELANKANLSEGEKNYILNKYVHNVFNNDISIEAAFLEFNNERAEFIKRLENEAKEAGLNSQDIKEYTDYAVKETYKNGWGLSVGSWLLNEFFKNKNYEKALSLGATEEEAREFINNADRRSNAENNQLLENYELDKKKGIKPLTFTQGFHHSIDERSNGENGYTLYKGQELYNQKYSVVLFDANGKFKSGWENGQYINEGDQDVTLTVKGEKTEVLPNEGKAEYSGMLFDRSGTLGGKLTYTVDFSNRYGSGRAENQSHNISFELKQGNIKDKAITAEVIHKENDETHTGSYHLEFFGPQAEEIGGKVEIERSYGNSIYGLAGTRGDIQ